MGARGPAPIPFEVKVIEGNKGKKKLPHNRPSFRPKAPRCPSWLDRTARREWRRLAPQLEKMRLLTEGDLAAFACYCKAYSDLQKAEEIMRTEGRIFTTEKGYMMPHPAVAMANQAMKSIKDFAIQFGFTPSARSRIDLEPSSDSDDEDLD